MKNILLVFSLFVLLFAMTACGPKAPSENVDLTPTPGGGLEAETPQGKVTYTEGQESGWCPKGAAWDFAGIQGEKANWKIDGIVSYKGGSYCHVVYLLEGGTVEGVAPMMMEYYYSEDKKDIYAVVKDETGKIVSEQHIVG